jgi:SAM-dependent methyltransferase
MKVIERTFDVITGDANMEDLHTMPDFPVFMGCVDHPRDKDICSELTWQINRHSGFIQLKKLIPLDILYQAQHAGAVGGIWMEHHQRFATFLSKTTPSSVLELGGAHGILSIKYSQFKDIPWTILEPNPAPIKGCKARFIKGFFDETFKYSDSFDTVVHSHVFEHIYKPDDFMKHISGFLRSGQKLVFSLPNMQAMLERKYTNCINFEHTVFLTEPYVEYLLAKHGFKLAAKEYFMDDHSIFYSAVRDAEVKPIPLSRGLYEENKKLYKNYVDHHKALIADLNHKISQTAQSVYLFGAHVFAQYLLEMGLNANKIVCLLDNDHKKQGRRLYGTKLNVASPEVLSGVPNPIVILKAGVYNDEIKKDILENINTSTTFI